MHSYITLLRPFTLLYPFLGLMFAAFSALGGQGDGPTMTRIFLSALAAALLNAASNVLNQISDIEIDKINKPERPLTSGALTISKARNFMIFLYLLALFLFGLVDYWGGHLVFWMAVVTTLITYIYSFGPRTKAHWFYANLTICMARGMLLTLIGWMTVKNTALSEAVLLGTIWSLFLFGAAFSKDFSDLEGDAKYNCRILPVQFGVEKAAWIMTPFLIFPFLFFSLFAGLGWLHANSFILIALSLALTLWGGYISLLILRNPQAMTGIENHPSWIHMYLLLMLGQGGQVIAYWC